MKTKKKEASARFTLWANRIVALVLVALAVLMPKCVNWYAARRHLPEQSMAAVLIAFYCCAVFVGAALLMVDTLLRNILARQIFVRKNVKLIRGIRWCCLVVCLACGVAAFWYLPLVFVAVIMAFLWLIVGVMADVMDAAVKLREETDLTI